MGWRSGGLGDGRRDLDIGLREVVAFEQQRQSTRLGERIAEEIAEIQCGRMAAALSVSDERGIGRVGLRLSGRDDFEHGQAQHVIHQNDRALATPAVDDHSRLDDRHAADQDLVGVHDDLDERGALWFREYDGDDRRSIDDDHLGRP